MLMQSDGGGLLVSMNRTDINWRDRPLGVVIDWAVSVIEDRLVILNVRYIVRHWAWRAIGCKVM